MRRSLNRGARTGRQCFFAKMFSPYPKSGHPWNTPDRIPFADFSSRPNLDQNIMLTTLDFKTALIIIDLQKGVVFAPVAAINEVVERASTLAAEFRKYHLPVVLVNVTGGASGRVELSRGGGQRPEGWTDLIPELNQQPSDYTISKQTWGAFMNTGLEKLLKDLEVTQVVVAGVATSIGVESTARQAYELGFNVTLATDAMADLSPETHENSITRIFPRLGETGTTKQIIELLSRSR